MTCLRHVALRCRDMEASRRFYEKLGMRFIGYRPKRDALDLADETVNMTLIQYNGDQRPAQEEGTEYVHFGFIVDDAPATFQRLQEAGAIFLRDNIKTRDPYRPGEAPPGSFKVEDPDGNVIDITSNHEEWRGAKP
jgi:catechol 2,3-dioxygenase-like lactoylglutathione lyase family enzyme